MFAHFLMNRCTCFQFSQRKRKKEGWLITFPPYYNRWMLLLQCKLLMSPFESLFFGCRHLVFFNHLHERREPFFQLTLARMVSKLHLQTIGLLLNKQIKYMKFNQQNWSKNVLDRLLVKFNHTTSHIIFQINELKII